MTAAKAILAIVICLPAMAAAEDGCPWLNAATAGGVLGGTVHAIVTATSCEFVRNDSALRIEVSPTTAPHAQCESGATPLKAIGNEAQACSYQGKPDQIAEQVVGRVRDQAFLVRLSAKGHSAERQSLQQRARNVAEQVAGILF